MPEAHKAVFDLKPGGISQLIPDSSGFYVYQLVSKQMVPIAQAKESIEKTLQAEKMEHALQQMSDSVKPELNPAYFGPGVEQPAGAPGARIPVRPTHPGAPKPAQKPPASPSGAAKP